MLVFLLYNIKLLTMLAEFHVLFSHWQPYSVGLNTWNCITLRKLEMREKNEHSNVKLTHMYMLLQ